MELAYRKGSDAFVSAGAFRQLTGNLQAKRDRLADVPAVVLSCFDARTRMLPFVMFDRFIFPAGGRMVAGAMRDAGFVRTRAAFQLWNPNFRPSAARLDGKTPQLLLLSTMQIHAEKAVEAICDAWTMGEQRPLILVGGPKAFHEPDHLWPVQTPVGPGGPDAVVTGEVYVLMHLLDVLTSFQRPGEHIRQAFERARQCGALEEVPGLVYLDPNSSWREPVLVDTGLQRLVQHLDELPDEQSGLSVMEPPHKGTGLRTAPLSDRQVRRHAMIVSVLMTQGCKFSCSYCPIPSLNQKTWRFRTPEGLARQLKTLRERFGIRFCFGTDDNFFNRRETALGFLEELARTRLSDGKLLGRQIKWATEATQFDTHKNLDLLPLARQAGMSAIWFGIEDLTAELVNKGQKPEKTIEVFRAMHRNKICPMAMMMFHDGQPFETPGKLYGLANQMDFLRRAGAVSVQVTIHTPAVGTDEFEKSYADGKIVAKLGDFPVTWTQYDGNHVLHAGATPMWQKQWELMSGYFRFYNPLNLLRAMRHDGSPLRNYRMGFQLFGFFSAVWTAVKLLPYFVRLLVSKPSFHRKAPSGNDVPVRRAAGSFHRHPEAFSGQRFAA